VVENKNKITITDLFGTPYPGEIVPTRNLVELKQNLTNSGYKNIQETKGGISVTRKSAMGRTSETHWDNNGIVVMTKLYESDGSLIRTNTYECEDDKLTLTELFDAQGRVTHRMRFMYGDAETIKDYKIMFWQFNPKTGAVTKRQTLTAEDRSEKGFNIFSLI
jgi:hypothetical protein